MHARNWLALCVLPWLASCGAVTTVAVPTPEVVRVLPPLSLMDCPPHPAVRTETVRDVVRGLLDTRATLAECHAVLARLREWRAGEADPGHGAE